MRNAILSFFLACLAFSLAGCSAAGPAAQFPWTYHESGYEIHGPQISRDNTRIVFARKRHRVFGHEAELAGNDPVRETTAAAPVTDPRHYDPEVMLVDLATNAAHRVNYGWSPAFSPDQTRILYAFQAKPLTGGWLVAAAFAGNAIDEYAIETGEDKVLAAPSDNGAYFSSPAYDERANPVFYISGAANGEWGLDIGAASANPATGGIRALYPPAMDHGLYHLVQKFQVKDGQTLVLRSRPMNKGLYMAETYTQELVKAASGTVLYSWGEHPVRAVPADFRLCPAGIEVYSDGEWKNIAAPGSPSLMGPVPPGGISSPDCSAMAFYDPNAVFILSADGKSLRKWTTPGGRIQSLTWSPDGSLVALVITHGTGFSEPFEHDAVVVLRVGDMPPGRDFK